MAACRKRAKPCNYWLSEGFTDFYTGRLLVRDGVWTPQQFAADLNDMLRAYAQSPVRAEPNARIVADFWSNQDVQRLPYQRGRMLALIWDGRLRANGKSFDDVVREMRARARAASEPSTAANIFPSVATDLGLDVSAELASNVETGAPILLPEDLLAPCGRIATREVSTFHRGFDIEATQANNNIIAGVDPTLPAYAAGIRNGMTLIRRDAGEIGDSEQEIAYVVRDGETERTFRYMPRGRGSFTLQEFGSTDHWKASAWRNACASSAAHRRGGICNRTRLSCSVSWPGSSGPLLLRHRPSRSFAIATRPVSQR